MSRSTGALTHRELPDAYAGANVVVVPSIQDAGGDRDGLPNVVLEAMASARPVVASEVAAIPAAVRDGDTGLLVPPGDTRALRAALERVASDPALRVGMGVAARTRVEHDFESGAALAGCSIASGTRMPDHARTPVPPSVAYVLKAFPRLSETYINSEIHRLEQAGLHLRLYATKPPEPLETGPHQPVVDRVRPAPVFIPRGDQRLRRVADHMASAQPETVPRPTGAHREAPAGGLARATAAALAQAVRARPRHLSPPRKVYVKEFLQAVALADLLREARDVRQLHAHYAHGSTTVAWFASMITGLPFSFTAHAKDVYSEALNPAGLLRRKLLAARFAVTCTGANVQHLRSIAPEARVHLVYHGLNDDLGRLVEGNAVARSKRDAAAAGRRAAGEKKGFDMFVEACGLCATGASGSSGDRRPGRPARPVVRRRIAELGLEDAVHLVGPMSQQSCCASTAAPTRCACRAAWSAATGTAFRTSSSRRWLRDGRS